MRQSYSSVEPSRISRGRSAFVGARIVISLFVGLFAHALWAQVSGEFLGVVTDPSGSAVPGVKIVLQSADTGFVRQTSTDQTGNYELLAVPVADGYNITAEAPGFEKTVQSGLRLLVNQRYRVDFTLQVGKVSQTVNVTGSPVQVESNSTQLGDVIQDRKIEALPLNGRSYLDLLGLQTGVVPTSNPSPFQPTIVASGNLTTGLLSVNGQRENANAFFVNGAIAEDNGSNGAGVIPTLDSIQEFRLLTSSFDSEFGHFSGAIVNVITKSGTNTFHGSVFEFLRNTDLDAKNYFDIKRGTLQRNQYGGTFGGPLVKNRLFFFTDYQKTSQNQGVSTGNLLVPSQAQKGGDLSAPVSALLAVKPSGTVRGDNDPGHMAATLSARLGYTVSAGEPYFATGCNSLPQAQAGTCVFPGGIIPKAAWSPAAAGLLQFFPQSTGVGSGPFPSFSSSAFGSHVNDNKWGMRVDFSANPSSDYWSFYYHYDDAIVDLPLGAANTFGTFDNIPGFGYIQPSRAQLAVISNTKIFSPSKVNEAHFSYHRIAFPGPTPTGGLGKVSTFGFTEGGLGLIPANPPIEGVPDVILNGLGLTMGAAITDGNFQNNFQLQDGFSWTAGKHTLKFGGEFAHHQWYRRGGPVPNGQFVFNGGESGIDFADFLIGAPDAFIQSSRQFIDARAKSGAAYVQDSFRVRPNLTINYGVRWEFSQPWADKQNRIQAFIPGEQSTVFTNSPTGWVFPGDKGVPTTLAPTRWNNFAPRLGVAYSPAPENELLKKILGGPGKTSIRAAAGKFYTTIDTTGGDFETGDAPFGFYYVSPSLTYLETPFAARASGADPGQRFPFVLPSANGSFAPFLPIALSSAFNVNNVSPYAMDFNLTVQRQLGNSTVFTVGYIGTQGRHLFQLQSFNAANPQKCLAIAALYAAASQPGGCGPSGEDTTYQINGQTFYGTRPFSVTSGKYLNIGELDFGDNPYNSTNGNSSYNSLQLTLDKKVGAMRFLGAYTWSKAMDDASSFTESVNPYNAGLSRGLSTFDVTNNFVVSYSYDLPFAHGLSSSSGLTYKLLNGWQLVGITRFTTGLPILLQETDDRSLCGCDGQGLHSLDLPNYDGQPIQRFDPRSSSSHQYFGTSVFSAMTLGVPGTSNRSFFHGPGINNWDIALHKGTQITERFFLEFRAEMFNTFNHAQFETPVGNFVASNFGQVTAARDPRIGQVALKLQF
jgi:hypothetical protein